MAESGPLVQAGRAIVALVTEEHAAGSLAERVQQAAHSIPADHPFWDAYDAMASDTWDVSHGRSYAANLDEQLAMSFWRRMGVAAGDALATPEHPRWAHFMDTLHIVMEADPTAYHSITERLHMLQGTSPVDVDMNRYALRWNPGGDTARALRAHAWADGTIRPPRLPATPQRPGLSPVSPNLGQDTTHRIFFSQPSLQTSHTSVGGMSRRSNTFPARKRMLMKWSTNLSNPQTSTTANTVTAAVSKLNEAINIGANYSDNHEPLGWTQMCAIYDRYVIKDVVVRVDYHNSSASDASPEAVITGLALKDDQTVLTTPGFYQELDHTVWTPVPVEGTGSLYLRIKPHRFFGISEKNVTSDFTLVFPTKALASTTSSTANQLYLHHFVHNMSGSSISQHTLHSTYTFHMDVTFLEPKDPAQGTAGV